MMFPMAYNLIKHFLCEETKKKIMVLGGTASTLSFLMQCDSSFVVLLDIYEMLHSFLCFKTQLTGKRSCRNTSIKTSFLSSMEDP